MIKAWSDEAWEDFEYWQSQDKKTLKRIMKLIKDIDRNGYVGIGKPEPLTGDLSILADNTPSSTGRGWTALLYEISLFAKSIFITTMIYC